MAEIKDEKLTHTIAATIKELEISLSKLLSKRKFCKDHNFNIEAQYINTKIEAISEICSELRRNTQNRRFKIYTFIKKLEKQS